MSQIGGQFGFFLGLSIITMFQIIIFILENIIKFILDSRLIKNIKLFMRKIIKKEGKLLNFFPLYIYI